MAVLKRRLTDGSAENVKVSCLAADITVQPHDPVLHLSIFLPGRLTFAHPRQG